MAKLKKQYIPVGGLAVVAAFFMACGDNIKPKESDDHGPIAPGISAKMGEPWPSATAEQKEMFARGMEVMQRRFDRSEGLGPAFNVTFCGGCHEKPVFGGAAGQYRNFFIVGQKLDGNFFPANRIPTFLCGDPPDDVVVPPEDRIKLPPDQYDPPFESREGAVDGVLRMYNYGADTTARPAPYVPNPAAGEEPGTFVPPEINVVGQRNPIPFFGAGLLAEIPAEEILKREDPDDKDGDGISGRAHLLAGRDTNGDNVIDTYDIGRFGVKAQTTSIEGFIRGPLYNHLGLTTDPLTEEARARLPIDSSAQGNEDTAALWHGSPLSQYAQAVAPTGPNCDLDDVLDPEFKPEDLFDLVAASMILAAPEFEPETERSKRGRLLFNEAGCRSCHTPRLNGPRGPIPVYSDLLLHDMGPELDDGLEFGEAETFEFRTQPLWGVSATAPYLHDGRAADLREAIMWHGGEAKASRDRFAEMELAQQEDLIEFLHTLGGRDQATGGLLLPDQELAPQGSDGAPRAGLSAADLEKFREGREVFDREHFNSEGLGGPRLNGDSCRACHFEPVIGGAGPRGTNVMRHGVENQLGEFVMPQLGTSILHKTTTLLSSANFPQEDANVFEHRSSPSLLGVGLIDGIPEENIRANADPNDENNDGISGRVAVIDGGKVGRFGWKAQVPSLREFVRDAVTAELGMTLPAQEGLVFGKIHDNDDIPDPEMNLDDAASLLFFMSNLAPPAKAQVTDPAGVLAGEALFRDAGCEGCHIPVLDGADGPVNLYSDLLLHEILPSNAKGIEEGSATVHEFRTAPLWGIGRTAPYLHTGAADTLEEAISAHAGEGAASAAAFDALTAEQKQDMILFLESL